MRERVPPLGAPIPRHRDPATGRLCNYTGFDFCTKCGWVDPVTRWRAGEPSPPATRNEKIATVLIGALYVLIVLGILAAGAFLTGCSTLDHRIDTKTDGSMSVHTREVELLRQSETRATVTPRSIRSQTCKHAASPLAGAALGAAAGSIAGPVGAGVGAAGGATVSLLDREQEDYCSSPGTPLRAMGGAPRAEPRMKETNPFPSVTETNRGPRAAAGSRFPGVLYERAYDADTITVSIQGERPIFGDFIGVRVLGVDTPEIRGACDAEKRAARVAAEFTRTLLRQARRVDLVGCIRPKYFRLGCRVVADGQDLTTALLNAGHGVPYDGGTKTHDWCEA